MPCSVVWLSSQRWVAQKCCGKRLHSASGEDAEAFFNSQNFIWVLWWSCGFMHGGSEQERLFARYELPSLQAQQARCCRDITDLMALSAVVLQTGGEAIKNWCWHHSCLDIPEINPGLCPSFDCKYSYFVSTTQAADFFPLQWFGGR